MGGVRSQGISSHGTDIYVPPYFGSSPEAYGKNDLIYRGDSCAIWY